VAPLGQLPAAVVVVVAAVAIGAVVGALVGAGVGAVVGVVVAAGAAVAPVVGDPLLEPPQAATLRLKTSAVAANRPDLPYDA